MRARFLPLLALAFVGTLGLAACATAPMAEPVASMDTLQALQTSGIAPIRVGDFKPAPSLPAGKDKSINSRAATIKPPSGNSFAAYLGQTLATELNAAGKLDGASRVVVTGFLTESELDSAGFVTASGSLAARFVVTREDAVVYDKVLRVDAQWESNFIGAIAIPAAISNYNALYPKLARALLEDPAFAAATKK